MLSRSIVILLFETTVEMPVSPSKVSVSPPATVSAEPESAAIVKLLEAVAVLTEVKRPSASTVITGTAVAEP